MTKPSVVSLDSLLERETDRIRVFLSGCAVQLRVGCHPSERHKPQTVVVALEVEAALPHHYQDLNESGLDRVINYEIFYRYLREELPKLGHIPLLETLAEQVINFCFEDRRIQKVRVKLEKPEMFEGTALPGIEVTRCRPGNKT